MAKLKPIYHRMALTRDFKETVLARAQRDARFREALFTEAITGMFWARKRPTVSCR